jgi:hypoxanthine phosphoribosyltransferase
VKPSEADKPPQLLIGEDEIARRIGQLAQEIVTGLGPEFVMAIVLKGAFVFGADLLRALGRLHVRPRVEFMGLSSYGAERKTSGDVTAWTSIPAVKGERVLLVEDILDSGLTVTYAMETLRKAGASELKVCALLDKPTRRRTPVTADYVGFTIPDRFVVGYGIDWAERWRELGHIAAVD